MFAGNDKTGVWLGAADGAAFAVVTPRSASVECPVFKADPSGGEAQCRDSVYAIAHELGHSFGLKHSCEQDDYPKEGCMNSVMQQGKPPLMNLLDGEKKLLLRNKFFTLERLPRD